MTWDVLQNSTLLFTVSSVAIKTVCRCVCVDFSKSSLAERFSAEFSNLNLIEVLAEFSLPSSLREHMDALSGRCQQVVTFCAYIYIYLYFYFIYYFNTWSDFYKETSRLNVCSLSVIFDRSYCCSQYDLLFRLSVHPSVTLCIVAKRYILQQKCLNK